MLFTLYRLSILLILPLHSFDFCKNYCLSMEPGVTPEYLKWSYTLFTKIFVCISSSCGLPFTLIGQDRFCLTVGLLVSIFFLKPHFLRTQQYKYSSLHIYSRNFLKPSFPQKPTFENETHVKSALPTIDLIKRSIYIEKVLLEQVNWTAQKADLTWGPFL